MSRAASPTSTGTSAFTPASRPSSPSGAAKVSPEDQEIRLDKIKQIPPFSDAKDWESTVFELKLILQQVWRDKNLDIIKYLSDGTYASSMEGSVSKSRADKVIYYILSSSSARGSFARNTIIAAQSKTAQPHIPDNEGLRLYNHFDL